MTRRLAALQAALGWINARSKKLLHEITGSQVKPGDLLLDSAGDVGPLIKDLLNHREKLIVNTKTIDTYPDFIRHTDDMPKWRVSYADFRVRA